MDDRYSAESIFYSNIFANIRKNSKLSQVTFDRTRGSVLIRRKTQLRKSRDTISLPKPYVFQCCPECKWYFRDVLFYACGGAAVLGCVALLLLAPFKVGQRRGQAAAALVNHPAADQEEARNGAAANGATERTPLLN